MSYDSCNSLASLESKKSAYFPFLPPDKLSPLRKALSESQWSLSLCIAYMCRNDSKHNLMSLYFLEGNNWKWTYPVRKLEKRSIFVKIEDLHTSLNFTLSWGVTKMHASCLILRAGRKSISQSVFSWAESVLILVDNSNFLERWKWESLQIFSALSIAYRDTYDTD